MTLVKLSEQNSVQRQFDPDFRACVSRLRRQIHESESLTGSEQAAFHRMLNRAEACELSTVDICVCERAAKSWETEFDKPSDYPCPRLALEMALLSTAFAHALRPYAKVV